MVRNTTSCYSNQPPGNADVLLQPRRRAGGARSAPESAVPSTSSSTAAAASARAGCCSISASAAASSTSRPPPGAAATNSRTSRPSWPVHRQPGLRGAAADQLASGLRRLRRAARGRADDDRPRRVPVHRPPGARDRLAAQPLRREHADNADLLLCLSGSDVSFFERDVVGYGATSYGRRTGSLRLRPFRWPEIARFHPGLERSRSGSGPGPSSAAFPTT